MLPVEDILLFVEVVKHKSFTIAAEKQGKTAAAVSGRISKLEFNLGVKLLKRTTRTLALTDAGRILFENCSGFHDNLKNIVETTIDEHKEPKGLIKISSMPNLSNLVLAPVINKFLEKYNKIEFDINLENSLYSLPPLDEYDIAFRSGKLEDSSAIARQIFSHDYIVCGTKRYFDKYGIPKDLEDLAHHNCLDCQHGMKGGQNTWTFYSEQNVFNVPVKGNIKTDKALFIKYLGLSDAALIYSPSFILADEVNSGILIPVLTQYKTKVNPITMVHPYTDRNAPHRVRLFIDFFIENMYVPQIDHRKFLKVG